MSDFYFSKIETYDKDEILNPFSSQETERKERRRNKKLASLGIFVGKTTPKVLDKAMDFETKVSKLKSENPDKAAELNLKKAWQLATLKAQGVKVKTEISKIKKTAKKIEKRKQQSAKRWEERQKLVKLEHTLKQRKRQRNIDNRRDNKRSKKYKRLVKRGHILPELPKE
ncbi:unnamed protein product [Hymenolepis diminuta]|uniref:Ribosomal RNA-processing protein 14/surfeit locus protein 6 C-terminal domain-containing protein n=1 Tax=Hymenolepis diminuta TaxID=6216 RepID=A0A564Z7W8_HYMDI|nr:unnamed protein product [Hymenolepis diminuta]